VIGSVIYGFKILQWKDQIRINIKLYRYDLIIYFFTLKSCLKKNDPINFILFYLFTLKLCLKKNDRINFIGLTMRYSSIICLLLRSWVQCTRESMYHVKSRHKCDFFIDLSYQKQSRNSIFTSASWYNGSVFYAGGVYYTFEDAVTS